MGVLVLRTLVRGIAVVLLVLTSIFIVGYVIGDPARLAVPFGASQEEYERMRETLGLDQPFLDQFTAFFHRIFTLDLGESFWQRRPAFDVAMERLPATLLLIAASFAIAFVVGSLLGVLAAMRRGSSLDSAISFLNTLLAATPSFWVGIVFILVFAVQLGWFPTSGDTGWDSLVLPAVTLSLPSIGRISQTVRGSLLAEQRRPYARLARAKGLSPARILAAHTARNAGVAMTTFSLWELTRLITGAGVVVEVIFAWPGIGQLTIQAVEHQDFRLVQACVLILTVLVVLVNLTADIIYGLLDPRLRMSESLQAR
jgi:peptide/nickel transport system permease protein